MLGTGAAAGVSSIADLAQSISDRTGIHPDLIYGMLMHESGGGTNYGSTHLHNYSGIINPGGKGYRDFGSDEAYENYFSNLLKNDYRGTLTAMNGEQMALALKHGRDGRSYMEDSVSNYAAGIDRNAGGYSSALHIETININVPKTNATAQDMCSLPHNQPIPSNCRISPFLRL
jgi:hypothetical protein